MHNDIKLLIISRVSNVDFTCCALKEENWVDIEFQTQKKPPLRDFFLFRGAEGRTRTGTYFYG